VILQGLELLQVANDYINLIQVGRILDDQLLYFRYPGEFYASAA
jgi:hypothetical protein